MSAQKKDAAAGAWASFETTNHVFKHSKTLAQTQHGSIVPFSTIAGAIHGQHLGARFAADIAAQTALPDELYSLVCKHLGEASFLKGVLRAVQKSLEGRSPR